MIKVGDESFILFKQHKNTPEMMRKKDTLHLLTKPHKKQYLFITFPYNTIA